MNLEWEVLLDQPPGGLRRDQARVTQYAQLLADEREQVVFLPVVSDQSDLDAGNIVGG